MKHSKLKGLGKSIAALLLVASMGASMFSGIAAEGLQSDENNESIVLNNNGEVNNETNDEANKEGEVQTPANNQLPANNLEVGSQSTNLDGANKDNQSADNKPDENAEDKTKVGNQIGTDPVSGEPIYDSYDLYREPVTESPALRRNTRAGVEVPDPSNLSQWHTYDHYRNNDTTTAKPASFNDYGGLRPWAHAGVENSANPKTYINSIDSVKNIIAGANGFSKSVHYFSQHIWVEGSKEEATAYFVGYSNPPLKDFMIYNTANKDTKAMKFDIDPSIIDTHTISGFGVFVNSGITGGTLKANLLYFGTNGNISLVKNINQAAGAASSGSLTVSGGTSVGAQTVTAGSKFQVSLIVHPGENGAADELTGTVTPYLPGNTVLNTAATKKLNAGNPMLLGDTGEYGFGPMVNYSSHGCSSLSVVTFSKMTLAVNYSAVFYKNDTGNVATEKAYARVDGIKPGSSVAGASSVMPANPTRPGWAFAGWNTQPDGSGQAFTDTFTLPKGTGIQQVYAIWKKVAVTLDYDKKTNWEKGPINGIATVTVPAGATNVTATLDDGTVIALTPKGDGITYTGTFPIKENTAGGKINVTASVPGEGTASASTEVRVTWLDTINPQITNQTLAGASNILIANDVKVSFNDPEDTKADFNGKKASGINESSKFMLLYPDGDTGKPSIRLPFNASNKVDFTSVPGGGYKYDIVVADNVGRETKASDKFGGGLIGPGGTGNPGEDLVIINAKPPTAEFDPITTPPQGPNSWTNKEVTVKFAATSAVLPLTTVEIFDSSGGKAIYTSEINGTIFDKIDQFIATKNDTYTVVATNSAGLTAQDTIEIRNIDKNPPKITLPAPGTDITKGDLTSAVKDDESGVKEIIVTFTEKDTGKVTTGDPSVIDTLPSGDYSITVTGKDNAGNEKTDGPVEYIYSNSTDDAAVKVTYDPDQKWTNGKVKVTVTVTSPIRVTELTIDGVEYTDFVSTSKTYTKTIEVDANKATMLISVKTMGTMTGTGSASVTWIDKVAPTITSLPNVSSTGNILTTANINAISFGDAGSPNASLNSATASGVAEASKTLLLYKVGNTDKTKPDYTIPFANLSQLSAVAEGEYKYDVQVKDNAGNQTNASGNGGLLGGDGTSTGDPIVLNPAGPKIIETGRTPSTGFSKENVTISFNVTDKIDLTSVTVDKPGGSTVTITVTPANKNDLNGSFIAAINGSYTITATDKAGQTTTEIIKVSNIDKLPPIISDNGIVVTKLEDLKLSITDPYNTDYTSSGIIKEEYVFKNTSNNSRIYTYSSLEEAKKNIPAGKYDLVVTATDRAGNSTTSPSNSFRDMTVGVVKPASAPVIEVVGGDAAMKKARVGTTIGFTVTYDDAGEAGTESLMVGTIPQVQPGSKPAGQSYAMSTSGNSITYWYVINTKGINKFTAVRTVNGGQNLSASLSFTAR